MFKRVAVPLYIQICLLFCLPSYCIADAGVIERPTLEVLSVTASISPLLISDTGSSISVISKEQILRRNAVNVSDLLREIPGIAVSQQGSLGSVTQVRVRGAEANQVLVLIDGVEANDVAQGSEFNFAHLRANQIERIEIVRGPQSAIWGSDAMAGVINVITRPGQTQGISFRGNVEAGSFDTASAGFGVQYGSDRHQSNLTIDRFNTRGTNISRHGGEQDGYRNSTVNLSGSTRFADQFELTYLLRHSDTTSEFDDVDFATTGLPVDAGFETRSRQDYLGLSAIFRGDRLDQILSISRIDTDNVTRTAATVDDVVSGIKEKLQYQANLLLDRHTLTGLLEAESEWYQQQGATTFFGNPNKRLNATSRAAAFEYRYNGDSLDVSASARQAQNDEFDDSTTWRLTAAWRLANGTTTLFSSVGESIKNPTFTERFGFFDSFIGNPELRPEQSFSWEVGIRQSLLDGRANFTAAWFDANLRHEINGFVFDPINSGFTAANVSGDSSRRGFEFGFGFAVTERLSLNGSYTYLDATQPDASGNPVIEVRRPKNAGSIGAGYAHGKLTLNLAVVHTGEQQDDFFPPFPPFHERVSLDGFTLVSVSGGYRINDHLEVTLRLENLLDQRYEEVFGFTPPGPSGFAGVRINF